MKLLFSREDQASKLMGMISALSDAELLDVCAATGWLPVNDAGIREIAQLVTKVEVAGGVMPEAVRTRLIEIVHEALGPKRN